MRRQSRKRKKRNNLMGNLWLRGVIVDLCGERKKIIIRRKIRGKS
ncbi:unnamed protein product [Spirodela intermedia]|uniref:Uncharacterized protein n=1 Tax=Spirodela intermedia TaxID=51605 RepID=A0A7I8KRJ6_SPIIN|nr:unnamed protein product [Spirodela intermedia]